MIIEAADKKLAPLYFITRDLVGSPGSVSNKDVTVMANVDLTVVTNVDLTVMTNADLTVMTNADLVVVTNVDLTVMTNAFFMCCLPECFYLGVPEGVSTF